MKDLVLTQRHADQAKRINDPDTSPHNYSWVFHKDARAMHQRKGSLFSKWCWEIWICTCRRMKLERYLSPCTKPNFKRTKNLHLSPDALKLLGGKSREDASISRHWWRLTAQDSGSTADNQPQSPMHNKGYTRWVKRQSTKWEQTFTTHAFDKGLVSRLIKESKI